MKKIFLMIAALAALTAMSACQANTNTEGTADTPASSPSTTDVPLYASADFAGHWAVSEVYDTKGKLVTGSTLEALDAGIILELLADGIYFVYAEDGTVLGQGQFAVSGESLVLTAGEAQTEYLIVDKDTLKASSDDGSITIMARQPEEPKVESTEPDDEDDIEDTEAPDDTDWEDTNIPDDDPEAMETQGA